MRHFRVNLFLSIIGGVSLSLFSGSLLTMGYIAWAIAAFLCACLFFIVLIVLVRKPIRLISAFVSALESNDRTIRFDSGCDDREVSDTMQAMDRMMKISQKSRLELETSKLYYDRILRVMTHEMRNSITPIISLADDYLKHPEKYDVAILSDTMDVIGSQAKGIKKFLDSYYSLTHLPEPKKQSVDIEDFFMRIRTLTNLEEKRFGFSHSICVFHCPIGMNICIDSDLLSQAMINIIRNALESVRHCQNPVIKVVASLSNGTPFITISDNGPGIPDTVKANLFQPFFTTKSQGSGIGLSLSRQILRLHNGDISISSSSHSGTTVTLNLE